MNIILCSRSASNTYTNESTKICTAGNERDLVIAVGNDANEHENIKNLSCIVRDNQMNTLPGDTEPKDERGDMSSELG